MGLLDHIWALYLTIWGTAKLFPRWLTILHSSQQYMSITVSPHPCQNLLLSDFLIITNHSSECEVVSHCDFDLNCPNNWLYWASFHMLIGHLCIIFGEMYIQMSCPLQTCSLFPCWQLEGPGPYLAPPSCWQSPLRDQLTHCPDKSMNHKPGDSAFPFC